MTVLRLLPGRRSGVPSSVGGASGSTASGIKLLRAVRLTSGSWSRVQDVFFAKRSQVLDTEEGTIVSSHASTTCDEGALVSFLWLAFVVAGVFVLLWTLLSGRPLEQVLFEVSSAQGNVGLSTGITGPHAPRSEVGIRLQHVARSPPNNSRPHPVPWSGTGHRGDGSEPDAVTRPATVTRWTDD
ncbi:potassium transporter TrkG [Halorussus sp. MSC15.2]|uniref:potassium transporter TrkG n=1 Tax=Halorussus sp. MSC15.2 TaxID=2283638 RepID=UPI0013D2ECFE|nr:potassium transporter TrkG [Halorussus sp. MSC15.2]NEU57307.1 hypothetical protein [Halorussus sp. MSC15.2]